MAEPKVDPGNQALPALDFVSHSTEQTRRIGQRLGRHLRGGDVCFLSGTFGAGKTLLAQGLAAGLGIADRVTSPSFTLVSEYAGRDGAGAPVRFYHVDLYRLEEPAALASVGLEECLDDPAGISAIEWPERLVPAPAVLEHLLVTIEPLGDTKRRLALTPFGARYAALVGALKVEAFGVDR